MAHDENHDPWIAHHFEGPRQQFDAGKLGIWVFLVTEILFFSGLFCAYVLYRAAQPEIFVDASTHLDKVLGGINTIVLLFSSLTMAIAVRSVQLGQTRTLIINLMITMVCAAIFLGVKAVEYSHKWEEGILTRGYYEFHHHEPSGISKYLIMLSILPLILLVVFAAAGILFKVTQDGKKAVFFGGLTLMMAGYFLGAVAGKVYMDVKPKKAAHAEDHGDHEHDAHAGEGHEEDGSKHDDKKSSDEDHAAAVQQPFLNPVVFRQDDAKQDDTNAKQDQDKSPVKNKGSGDSPEQDKKSGGQPKTDGKQSVGEKSADDKQSDAGGGDAAEAAADAAAEKTRAQLEKERQTGIFFSIYYCMTGLHAIHVIAGMVALSWLLWRACHNHFRADYFGPVDYVGLYWHLVDLIWIYLFPLLYLIN